MPPTTTAPVADQVVRPQENPTADLQEYRVVSLEDYVEAYSTYKNFLARLSEEELNDPENLPKVQSVRDAFNNVRNAFTEQNGQILNRYICGYSSSAAMICLKPGSGLFRRDSIRYFSQYELGTSPEIESLLIDIDFLAAESTRLLRGKSLNRCLGLIYKVAKNTLVLQDSINQSRGVAYNHAGNPNYMLLYDPGKKPERKVTSRSMDSGQEVDASAEAQKAKLAATIKVVEANLKNARTYHEKAAKLTAQMDYFFGNTLGFGGILLILAILAFVNGFSFSNLENALGSNGATDLKVATLLYFGITSGCIGAIISVMTRISTGNLQLNHEPDSQTIRIIGLIRPFIGGVFGGLLLLLLNSGMSIFDMADDNPSKAIANFIVLGFIAGFFERFVPDILDQTKSRIGQNDRPAPEAEPV